MRQKIIFYYKKLSLVQRLSIPLLLASLFGFLLTIVIVKQVQSIQDNTAILKDSLIPVLEKSTNNMAFLKNISEKLTMATLTGEEDMVFEINENKIIERNIRDIVGSRDLTLGTIDGYINAFENYFRVATEYALNEIQPSLEEDEDKDSQEDIPEVKEEPIKGTFYYGEFPLVGKLARPIPKVGDEYKPIDEMQIKELEYQVTQFRVEKTIVE